MDARPVAGAKSKAQQQLEADARYKVGDVVVTTEPVTCKVIGSGNNDGWAAVGWKWRVVAVTTEGRTLRYEVVAHTAPKIYRQVLKQSQIAKKV